MTLQSASLPPEPETTSEAPRVRPAGFLRRLVQDPKARIGLIILTVFVLLALLAPVLFPDDPGIPVAPGSEPPSWGHPFGTTKKGEDVLALLLWGARSSLAIGFVVGVAATLVGLVIGLVSAYFGRAVDDVLTLVTNIFLLLPGLPLLIILAAFLPPGAGTMVLVLVLTGWAGSARVIRSQAMSVRGKDFIDAAVVSGERPLRVMFREILPNMASIVMSTLLGCVIGAIGAQAGLEFLGFGDINAISWGTNLFWSSNEGALITGTWWTFVPPGVCIALVAFSLAMVNYAVDQITNPRLGTQRRARRRNGGRR